MSLILFHSTIAFLNAKFGIKILFGKWIPVNGSVLWFSNHCSIWLLSYVIPLLVITGSTIICWDTGPIKLSKGSISSESCSVVSPTCSFVSPTGSFVSPVLS